jgi:hypothetical protein
MRMKSMSIALKCTCFGSTSAVQSNYKIGGFHMQVSMLPATPKRELDDQFPLLGIIFTLSVAPSGEA